MAKDDPMRATRLADALRTNLRRRKAQARAVHDETGAPDLSDQASTAGDRADHPSAPLRS